MAKNHYLQVTDELFELATEKAAQQLSEMWATIRKLADERIPNSKSSEDFR